MSPRPVAFVKAHPVAVVTSFAAGAIFWPWLSSMIGSRAGVNISLPTYGSNSGG